MGVMCTLGVNDREYISAGESLAAPTLRSRRAENVRSGSQDVTGIVVIILNRTHLGYEY